MVEDLLGFRSGVFPGVFFVVTPTLIWLASRLGYRFRSWFQTHDLILMFNMDIPHAGSWGKAELKRRRAAKNKKLCAWYI